MKKGLIGKKIGMTQIFDEAGNAVPVTVVEAGPCVVTQKKTTENDGYEAVQVGFGDVKVARVNKPMKGHFDKANVAPKKTLKEFRLDDISSINVGDILKADVFAAGDVVDVTGTSKGKGYSGQIKRNNGTIGPKSHGSGHHRHVGSLATNGRNNGVVNKGLVLPGQMGNVTTTNQNLTIVKVNAEEGYILVKGNVPGPRKG